MEEEGLIAKGDGIASANRFEPAAEGLRDEPVTGERADPESNPNPNPNPRMTLMERVLERTNLKRALKQVRRNHGAAGIDAMSVDELPEYLKLHWGELRAQLETGRYRPQPVRRVEIPKPDGRKAVRLSPIPIRQVP